MRENGKNRKQNRLGSCLIAVGLAAFTASTPALAGMVINATEVGGDVIFEGGGTLNLSLWTFSYTTPDIAQVLPSGLLLVGTGGDLDVYDTPVNFVGPTSIGPGSDTTRADIAAGDKFGTSWAGQQLAVPTGYTSGDPLSGSATFSGHTFDSLGVAEGVYHWTWDTADGRGDFFTINIIVPAPGAPGVIALLALTGMFGKRRRRNV